MSGRFKVFTVILLVVIIALLVFLIVKLTGKNNNTVILPTTNTSTSIIPAPPQSPSNLAGKASSTSAITLVWQDNSSDEYGFIIYRDSIEITKLGPNFTNFTNTGLKASSEYLYSVKAYNQAGESTAISCSVKTLNPSLTIRLEKIGVFDNREDITRGESGEV